MTASPVGCSGVSGPVDGRSVAAIRADLAHCDRDGTPWPQAARRLLADVPALLAEVEAAHRFEVSAAAEREALLGELEAVKRDRARLIAKLHGAHRERDSLRGVVQAVEAMVTHAECRVGWLSHSGADHRVKAVPAHLLRVALAGAADAPLPEPAKITYGPRVPSRRVDLSEWDSHRPDFLPAGPSPAVLPQPTKDDQR